MEAFSIGFIYSLFFSSSLHISYSFLLFHSKHPFSLFSHSAVFVSFPLSLCSVLSFYFFLYLISILWLFLSLSFSLSVDLFLPLLCLVFLSSAAGAPLDKQDSEICIATQSSPSHSAPQVDTTTETQATCSPSHRRFLHRLFLTPLFISRAAVDRLQWDN